MFIVSVKTISIVENNLTLCTIENPQNRDRYYRELAFKYAVTQQCILQPVLCQHI